MAKLEKKTKTKTKTTLGFQNQGAEELSVDLPFCSNPLYHV